MSGRNDAYTTFKFWIEIEGITEAFFTECTGLQAEISTSEEPAGGANTYIEKVLGQTKYPDLVFKRGVSSSKALWDWFKQSLQYKPKRKNISVILFDAEGKEVRRWNFLEACPVKWKGPDLRASQAQMAVEELTVVHRGLQL